MSDTQVIEAARAIGQLFEGVGALGFLILMVYWFVTGRIVSTVNVKYITENVAIAIRKEIKAAVKEGFIEAHYELNGRRKEDGRTSE